MTRGRFKTIGDQADSQHEQADTACEHADYDQVLLHDLMRTPTVKHYMLV